MNPNEVRIWCADPIDEGWLGRLRAAAPSHVRPPAFTREVAGLQAAEVAFGKPVPETVLAAGPLRWVHLMSAGYEAYDLRPVREEFRRRGIALTNSSSAYADSCAQQALAAMLALNRGLLPAHRNQLEGRAWPQWPIREHMTRLTGQAVVLLGFGAIGRRLAALLRPFEVRLLALRRAAAADSGGVRTIGAEALGPALAEADHVVNVLPLNEGTRGFMSADRLAGMKTGAAFYNIGRGATVDQEALLAELAKGRLRAYLDVMTPEPLAADHPLWQLPNCLISPHIAGGDAEEERRLTDLFLANLESYLGGRPLTDRIF
jgi:phosphoglycerate dehydrogenase-like enzyme